MKEIVLIAFFSRDLGMDECTHLHIAVQVFFLAGLRT